MKTAVHAAVLLIGGVLTACGSPDDSVEDAARDADRETAFDPLVETLDDAGQLQDLALEKKNGMDEALRRMEGEQQDPEP